MSFFTRSLRGNVKTKESEAFRDALELAKNLDAFLAEMYKLPKEEMNKLLSGILAEISGDAANGGYHELKEKIEEALGYK